MIYTIVVENHQSKDDIRHQKNDIDGEKIVARVKAHRRNEYSQKHRLEDHHPSETAQFTEYKARNGILFPIEVIGAHHDIGGVPVQDIEQNKEHQLCPKQTG